MRVGWKHRIIFLIILGLFGASEKTSHSTAADSSVQNKLQIFQPVINTLISKGVDTAFIYKLIADSRTNFDERFVKINVTGYLKKPDYSGFYNDYSVDRSRDFLLEHYGKLKEAQQKYGVSMEAITSILWIETRHGNYLGKSHVASVYLSTALADSPEFVSMNIDELDKSFDGSKDELKELEQKIRDRAESKTEWAIDELLALEKLENKYGRSAADIYGSWAGAFGISQFLPSSYVKWAVDGNADGVADLFDIDDAIMSVGNYLKINGWSQDKDSRHDAVYHYNHSEDYVDAVLTLAKKLQNVDTSELENSNISVPLFRQGKGKE